MAKEKEEEQTTITIRVPTITMTHVGVFLAILLAVSVFFNFRGGFSRTAAVTGPLKLSGLVYICPPGGCDVTRVEGWCRDLGFSLTEYQADWTRGPIGLLFTDSKVSILDVSSEKEFYKSVCDSTNNKEACEISKKAEQESSKTACEQLEKVGKPMLNAFVVSYCPFGLQMQRVLVLVQELLGDNVDIKVRYIGSVQDGRVIAMHGEEEASENLRQVCLREEEPDKFWDYIACFIKKGETENCLDSIGIDKENLDGCMSDVDRGIKYIQEDFDLQNKYGISGSPTLILNGKKASEFNFGGRTAEAVKSMLCCAFKEKPGDCEQKLSTKEANRGFAETYGSGGSSGSRGSC